MIRTAIGVFGVAAAAPVVLGAPIYDATFFDGIPSALIDFETDGSGAPVGLADGNTAPMPGAEYAAQGVTFSPGVDWANDGGSDFEAAIAIGGSPVHTIIESGTFLLQFTGTVRAFGFWVIDNNTFGTAPSFTARDGGGNALDVVTFTGAAIDGTVGMADYGFMGISSATPIADVVITGSGYEMDDLRFSEIPAPGSAAVLSAIGVAALRRRR